MKFALLMLLILIDAQAYTRRVVQTIFVNGTNSKGSWNQFSQNPEMNVKNLLQKLSVSPHGRFLVRKAAEKAGEQGNTIFDLIKPGKGSLTDTTLIRRFSVQNPNEINYETRSIVYINEDLDYFDATLDLAHELTHLVYRKSFNPYQVNFTMEEFIKNTIEAEGGEAHAFVSECKVLQELFPAKLKQRKNCLSIYNENSGDFAMENAAREFYHLGHYYDDFMQKVGKHNLEGKFPHVTAERASFISSAYGLPYPIAAYEEYTSVLKKVCQNDKNRLVYMMKEKGSRTPASEIAQAEKKYSQMCDGKF